MPFRPIKNTSIPKGRETIQQMRSNVKKDPLTQIYMQHMDLVYRLCNVGFAKSESPHDCADLSHRIYVNIYTEGLKNYLVHKCVYLPCLWICRKDGRATKVTIGNYNPIK